MKILEKINVRRRYIMKTLTKNIGKSHFNLKNKQNFKIKKILISRPNHRLGNLLLLTPLVQEVINTFPDCKIDLFVKGNIAPFIFKNYENVDRIIQLPNKPFSNIQKYCKCWFLIRSRKYDLVINAVNNSSSGKLSILFSKSPNKFYGEVDNEFLIKKTDYQHIAKKVVYNLRYFLNKIGFNYESNHIPNLNIKLSKEEIENGNNILNSIAPKNQKTICLFTNATGDKCYSENWWKEFYKNLKKEFPNYNIVELLPIENISRLGFEIPTYYSKDVREMASFIVNADFFIAADSGIMHLASASETSTIGLFSVTNEEVYMPYNDNSLGINTKNMEIFELAHVIKFHVEKIKK